MFSKLIESVTNQYTQNLPFVIYRKPNEQVVQAILQADDQVHQVTDFNSTGFVFAPFDSNESAILFAADTIQKATYDLKSNLKVRTSATFKEDSSQKEFHIDLIHKGIRQIQSGAFKKVVLSRMVATACETSPVELFKTLLHTYSSAFCYLWHHPEIGTWLGATPEILLKTENNKFTTMSLAGTKKYIEGQVPEWGSKELEEQQLVTDYISNALDKTISNVKVSDRESARAGNLWHLRTKLTGIIEKGSLSSIIKALHPTPAVCGMPMQPTQNFILANENYNREYYTGFLGELNFKEDNYRSRSGRNQENKAYRVIRSSYYTFCESALYAIEAINSSYLCWGEE